MAKGTKAQSESQGAAGQIRTQAKSKSKKGFSNAALGGLREPIATTATTGQEAVVMGDETDFIFPMETDEHVNSDYILKCIGTEEAEEALHGLHYRIDHLYENQRKRGFELGRTVKKLLGRVQTYELYGSQNLDGEDPAKWSLPNGYDSSPDRCAVPHGYKTAIKWTALEDKEYTGNGGWIYRRNFYHGRNAKVDRVDTFVRRRVWRRVSVDASQLEMARASLQHMERSTSVRRAFNLNFLRRVFKNDSKLCKKFLVQIVCENERCNDEGSFASSHLRLETDPPMWTMYTEPLFPEHMADKGEGDERGAGRVDDARSVGTAATASSRTSKSASKPALAKPGSDDKTSAVGAALAIMASKRLSSGIAGGAPGSVSASASGTKEASPSPKKEKEKVKKKESIVHEKFRLNAEKKAKKAEKAQARKDRLEGKDIAEVFDPNVLFNRENGVYYGREEHDIITSNGARWASFGDKPSRESTQLPKNFVFCKGFNFCVDVDTDPLGYQYATSFPLPRPATPGADVDADDLEDKQLLASTTSTHDYMTVGGGHEGHIDVGEAVDISHAGTMKVRRRTSIQMRVDLSHTEAATEWRVRRRLWARIAVPKGMAARAARAILAYAERRPRGVILEHDLKKAKGQTSSAGFHNRRLRLTDCHLSHMRGYKSRGNMWLVGCDVEACYEAERTYQGIPPPTLAEWQSTRRRYPSLIPPLNTDDDVCGDYGHDAWGNGEGVDAYKPLRTSFSQKVTSLFVRTDSNNDVRTASMSLTIGEAHAVRDEAHNPMHGGGGDVRGSDLQARASDHRPFDSAGDNHDNDHSRTSDGGVCGGGAVRYDTDGTDLGTIVTTDSGKHLPRKLAKQTTMMDRLMGRDKKRDLYEVYTNETQITKEMATVRDGFAGIKKKSFWRNLCSCVTRARDYCFFASSDRVEAQIWAWTLRHQVNLISPQVIDVDGGPPASGLFPTDAKKYTFRPFDFLPMSGEVVAALEQLGGKLLTGLDLVGDGVMKLGALGIPGFANLTEEQIEAIVEKQKDMTIKLLTQREEDTRADAQYSLREKFGSAVVDSLGGDGKLDAALVQFGDEDNPLEENGILAEWLRAQVLDHPDPMNAGDEGSDDTTDDSSVVPNFAADLPTTAAADKASTAMLMAILTTLNHDPELAVSSGNYGYGGEHRAGSVAPTDTEGTVVSALTNFTKDLNDPSAPPGASPNAMRLGSMSGHHSNFRGTRSRKTVAREFALMPNTLVGGLACSKRLIPSRGLFHTRFCWVSIVDGLVFFNWAKGSTKPAEGDSVVGKQHVVRCQEPGNKQADVANTSTAFKSLDMGLVTACTLSDKVMVIRYGAADEGIQLRLAKETVMSEWVLGMSAFVKQVRTGTALARGNRHAVF